MLRKVFQSHLETNSLDVGKVLTASHDTSVAKVVSRQVLQLFEWDESLIFLDVYPHVLKLLIRPGFGFAPKVEFHENFGAAVSHQIRVLANRKLSQALLYHERHLRICLVGCNYEVDFELMQDVHKEVNHSLPQHKASLIVLASVFNVALLFVVLGGQLVLQLVVVALFLRLTLCVQVVPIEHADRLDLSRFQ